MNWLRRENGHRTAHRSRMTMGDISTKKVLLLIVVIAVAVLTLAVVRHNLDFSFFLGLLFNDAKEFASQGIITSPIMPVGYSGFLGSCMRIGGEGGIPACQALVYIGILLAAFWFLKLRGVRGTLLALGILAVSFHPMLLLNVWRVHDGNMTVLLLLGFLAAGISFMHFRNLRSVLLWGVFAGLLFTVRQNTIPFFLIALPFLYRNGSSEGTAGGGVGRFGRIALFLMSAAVLMVSVNVATKHTPFFFGQQGAYNFFSGTNEYAAEYMRKDYSGENSLEKALTARGFSSVSTFKEWLSVPSRTYWQLAFDYIKNHPLEYVKLAGLKLFTFLRPGYHIVQDFAWGSVDGLKRLLKIALSAPFFIWLFFVYRTRRNFFDRENLFVLLSIALYLLPFLLANADPRYRFPLDIIFIVDSFCRVHNLRAA
ncbi:MAG: hypothetical protein V1696_02380 [Candidatus Jorgensenbacteria bacterium]